MSDTQMKTHLLANISALNAARDEAKAIHQQITDLPDAELFSNWMVRHRAFSAFLELDLLIKELERQ